jgi:PAS domain S-box-containing protein
MSVKFSSLEKYFDILELLFNALPYVFWKDKQGKYQGSNMNQALNFGVSSPTEFIGKTIYEILQDQESAKTIDEVDQEIMQKNKPLVLEENIVTPNGKRCYLSQKLPIPDKNGEVIGLLGFAVDITEFKQQEEAIKKERDRDQLLRVAAQVAHDIRSPAASILMLAKSCQDLPENERVALREAAISIQDIAKQIKHFTNGTDALAFMNGMSHYQKEKIFLLTDYELLKQRWDGLDIISQGKIKRSVLVTSHYGNQLVRDQASKIQAKILPKQLAPEIPIELQDTISIDKKTHMIEKVDVIIVDDDENYVNALTLFAFSDKKIAKYHDPSLFLIEVSKYPKDTQIYLDNNFKWCDLKGIDVAKELNVRGYTKIYLLSGEIFDKDNVPSYLNIINKFDIEKISKL